MDASTTRYAPCPRCQALNMAHRERCYRCQQDLVPPAKPEIAPTPPAPVAARDRVSRAVAGAERKEPRVPVFISRAALEAPGSPRHNVTIRDISSGGALIQSSHGCAPGSAVTLRIFLHGTEYTIRAIVRHVRPAPEYAGAVHFVGLEFAGITPKLRQILAGLV